MRIVPVILLVGCSGGLGLDSRHVTVAPPHPVPLADLNTAFDDYNAAKPASWRKLVWSTNRGSRGEHLDVWSAELSWSETPSLVRGPPAPLAPAMMSPGDERGPLVIDEATAGVGYAWRHLLVFASDRDGGRGGLDLYWGRLDAPEAEDAQGVQALGALNSPANDAYLTLRYGERQALFASDRDGGLDLYEVVWETDRIDAAAVSIERSAVLSSDGDDTAPYVDGARELLVFASTRTGGAGGYDLWCADRRDGGWTAPRPLAAFNSSADEFRPSLFTAGGANFLVFSSNRPGGKGGFDLYAVRFDRCPAS